MIRYNHHYTSTTRDYIYRILALLGAVVLLVVLLPHKGDVLPEFRQGQTWYSHAVYADEDFHILKPDDVRQAEIDSLMASDYRPYFDADPHIVDAQVSAFVTDFNTRLPGSVPAYYRQHIVDRLREIYTIGVVSMEAFDRLEKEKMSHILIVWGSQEASETNVSRLHTPKSAYEYLLHDEDSARYHLNVLRRCNLDHYITPNVTYNQSRSESRRLDIENSVSLYRGKAIKGQKIVDFGDVVRGETYDMLRTLSERERSVERTLSERWMQRGGQTLYVALILVSLLLYFVQFRLDYLQSWRPMALVALLTLAFPIITYVVVSQHPEALYAIPYCILPFFVRVFLDSRTAFITHMSSILLSAIAVTVPFDFVFLQTVAGLMAIYSMKQLSERRELFRASLWVTLLSALCYTACWMMRQEFAYEPYIYILINGALLLISYLLLVPFERLFGFTSTVTLAELSNTNNPLLRRLSADASGTFQHSMQVANLAGEVANRLGADSQLVRTAAFYHDIGKLNDPNMFTENQHGPNPHDRLSRIESANIIRMHVANGLRIAEANKLPEVIRAFISAHHGTSLAKYFYLAYCKENPDITVDESLFRYPGPNPCTLEQAILMMSDSVEAASHSLNEYTETNIRTLVNSIIDSQVADHLFDECPITFEDIRTTKDVLAEKLMAIYHTRVAYPDTPKQA
ncbi:MAG: HDIG domain-containing protein [Bacteroidaceae bacterium]|nr:HDIG domain-containing protein [Bacteroidaceae bacterium]